MRAVQIKHTGGPEALELVDLPMPTPGAGQVLVKIIASGINFVDVYFREGRYPADLPFTPGQEAAGTVEAVGEGVKDFAPGDRVAWTGTRGTYAEYAVAPARDLLHLPASISFEQAAAVLTQGLTAHYLAHSTYAIQPGDTVLVHAGAGGVGLLLTQIAVQCGARVLSTVSTEEKAELSRSAGASRAILYTRESFLDAVQAETGGKGLPVVYDSVGKTTFEHSLRCLRPRGLMALYGASSGAVPPFDLIRLSTAGSLFVTRPTLKDYVQSRSELESRANAIFALITSGKLAVHVSQRYTLEQVQQVHQDLEGRRTTGKVLLAM